MKVTFITKSLVLVGLLSVLFCASFVFGQSDMVVEDDAVRTQPRAEVQSPSRDYQSDAQFELRIQEIRDEALRQTEELETALIDANASDQETYRRQIAEINKNTEIAILEVRKEQEIARGNEELAAKFQRAAELLRNPAPRQTPNPAQDAARFDQERTANETTRTSR